MALTTYGELKSAVADWLNRTDLTARIPDFISLAHAKLNRQLRVMDMVQRSAADVTAQYTSLPDDFLEMRNIQLNVSTPKSLEYLTPEQMDQERALGNTAREPVYYSIMGKLLEVFPTPDATYEVEMAYFQNIPSFTTDSSTNWLMTKAPSTFLYGSLLQAAPYLKEDERAPVWLRLHDESVAELMQENERAKFGGGTLKMRHRTFG
jgi:hypothetical protein